MGKKKSPILIVRSVIVNPLLAPQQVVYGLLEQYTDFEVLLRMPDSGKRGERIKVYFFQLVRNMSDDELAKEYRFHDLKPADPFSVAQINKNDLFFCKKHPNFTHWKNEENRWCFLAVAVFNKPKVETVVDYSKVIGWDAGWWAAGVRKS